MPKKHLSQDSKLAIIRARESGRTLRDIARQFNVDHKTILNICKKNTDSHTLNRKVGSGRPRKTSIREERVLINLVKLDPRKTARDVKTHAAENMGLDISQRTARRILCRAQLFARRSAKKPMISAKNKKARLRFAKCHQHWSSNDWANVVWSDESKFNLFSSDGICWVRRPVGTRFDPKYQVPTVKHGGGNVLVWGCFNRHGVGPLVNIEGIMDKNKYRDILETVMLPHCNQHMPQGWVFQQDNDPKHSSRLVKYWFEDHDVEVLEWPSQSPDLNPIEHLWEHLDRQIRHKNYKNSNDLMAALQTEWQKISTSYLEKLVDSMPARCQAVIAAKGYATKY